MRVVRLSGLISMQSHPNGKNKDAARMGHPASGLSLKAALLAWLSGREVARAAGKDGGPDRGIDRLLA